MEAKIKINPEKKIGKINRNIYGHFIEHLGRCIYGGIYEENSKLSDENFFRKDVLEAIKKIKVPVLRWPGGNFASNYHWIDGIGPKEKRPKKLDTAWMGEDNNHFGTDEFLKYCKLIGAEPYICLNFGTGTLEEALAWVEYCNYDGDTFYANLRKKYKNEKPYKVKYWGLGNEIYGRWQHGYCTAEEYANKAREYSQFIKKIDPTIKTIAVGANEPDWDRKVIKIAGEIIDYISIHMYFTPSNYYETVGLPYFIDERIKLLEQVIEIEENNLKRENPIEIAFDEWNIWRKPVFEEENYFLADGLFACGVFHILHRHCKRVTMANLAQLVNILGAIHTEKEGLILTPLYYAFLLYANNTGEFLIDSSAESETYSISYNGKDIKNIPYLDTSVTGEDNILYIAVINRHKEEKIKTHISIEKCELKQKAEITFLTGNSPEAFNTIVKENVKVENSKFEIHGNAFEYEFPPFSATIIKIEKNDRYY